MARQSSYFVRWVNFILKERSIKLAKMLLKNVKSIKASSDCLNLNKFKTSLWVRRCLCSMCVSVRPSHYFDRKSLWLYVVSVENGCRDCFSAFFFLYLFSLRAHRFTCGLAKVKSIGGSAGVWKEGVSLQLILWTWSSEWKDCRLWTGMTSILKGILHHFSWPSMTLNGACGEHWSCPQSEKRPLWCYYDTKWGRV